ncbi:hypothetical protein [Roseateles sp. P5_E11]
MKARCFIGSLQLFALMVGSATPPAGASTITQSEGTRVEVVADLARWHRSGLADLVAQREVDGPSLSTQVRAAERRYAALRASSDSVALSEPRELRASRSPRRDAASKD